MCVVKSNHYASISRWATGSWALSWHELAQAAGPMEYLSRHGKSTAKRLSFRAPFWVEKYGIAKVYDKPEDILFGSRRRYCLYFDALNTYIWHLAADVG